MLYYALYQQGGQATTIKFNQNKKGSGGQKQKNGEIFSMRKKPLVENKYGTDKNIIS